MITMFESGSVRLLYLLAIYFNSLDVFKPATSGVVECDALHGGHGQLCYRFCGCRDVQNCNVMYFIVSLCN